jgi:phosphohistidine phosphatase SixA
VSPTPVYLVRHAKAGRRADWDGPDTERPLTKAGRRQAEGLVRLLRDEGVTRIVTSPFVRCRETVEPLGAALGIRVEDSPSLVEGAPLPEALRLVEKVSDAPTVLCTHGDVLLELLDHLRRAGLVNGNAHVEKGSTWRLDTNAGEVTGAAYLAPPPDTRDR